MGCNDNIDLGRIYEYQSPNEGKEIINSAFEQVEIRFRCLTASTGVGDSYWTSGSTGTYSVKAINNSGLDAIGQYSVAEGNNTTASGYSSHAEGNNTTAYGASSHAEGYLSKAYLGSHAEGYDTMAAGYSHVEGNASIASGNVSHAEGQNTRAIGEFSHSEGFYTSASGNSSHAEGQFTTANGDASHSSGYYNITNANYSQILGGSGNTINTIAIGSAIVGASGITANAPYTTYVNNININNYKTLATSGDTSGVSGNFTWDDNYLYIRTNRDGGGWGRVALDYNF